MRKASIIKAMMYENAANVNDILRLRQSFQIQITLYLSSEKSSPNKIKIFLLSKNTESSTGGKETSRKERNFCLLLNGWFMGTFT